MERHSRQIRQRDSLFSHDSRDDHNVKPIRTKTHDRSKRPTRDSPTDPRWIIETDDESVPQSRS
ncbi:MAG: hypothetical protein DWI02_00380 [Planctomycetota bacterium]|nr:MAG: hypothetical protein DWI02_00380 [Planctomycetota bacterium]